MQELLKQLFFDAEAPIGLITLGIRSGKKEEDTDKILDKLFRYKNVSRKTVIFADLNKFNKAY